MARPAKFDRDEALEFVMNEIWRNGYEACSVKAISEKLGITRSSFYNTFTSREALFMEAFALYVARAPDRMLSEFEPGGSVRELMTKLFRKLCRQRAADPEARGCMAINCIAELVGVDPALGGVLEKAVKAKRKKIEQLLIAAADSGEIEDDGELAGKALAVMNLLVGLNLMSKVVRSEKQLWASAKAGLEGLGLYAAEAR